MQSITKRLSVAAALAATLVTGCDDEGAGETMATDSSAMDSDSTDGASSGGECNPGHEGCACVDGDLCLAGLVCASQVCVDLGGATTGGSMTGGSDSDSGKGSDTDDTGGNTGTEPCQDSDDCLDTEVCVEGVCGDTDWYYFWISVDRFDPPDCVDGWGSAEVYYDYYMDEVNQQTSSESICPGEWPDEPLYYDSLQSFRLAFWEADAFYDDFITSLCWLDSDDECLAIPKEVLHDGFWAGTDSSGDYYIELTIDPIEGYGETYP